jgi:hypothetical protein
VVPRQYNQHQGCRVFVGVQTEDGLYERQLPAEILRKINIVDTPGTNVIVERQQRLTEEFVPRSDLVLFILSADRPFTESEVRRSCPLFVVPSCTCTTWRPLTAERSPRPPRKRGDAARACRMYWNYIHGGMGYVLGVQYNIYRIRMILVCTACDMFPCNL